MSDFKNCSKKHFFYYFSAVVPDPDNVVIGAYIGISHATEDSNRFGLPFCEECRGLRAAALQQILDTQRRKTHPPAIRNRTVLHASGGVLP